MKIVGLITEYNPFHNGHLYHIKESLRVTGADAAVVVMSGDYVQRGTPAIMPKRIRAEMALMCGAGAVFELPVCYATGSAELFALGSVSLLESLGIVDSICFGSECGEIEPIQRTARLLNQESGEFKKRLQDFLKAGKTFPEARSTALAEKERDAAELLSSPNNPTGRVFTREELLTIAEMATKYDVYVITDEVYEHIVYAPHKHTYFATLPGMWERTISCSSLSKTYSITGWRLGYIIAPAEIIDRAKKVHDFLTVGAAAPLQEAVIPGLKFGQDYYDDFLAKYTHKKELFLKGLDDLHIVHNDPEGAYYVLMDVSEFGYDSDLKFCEDLARLVGVGAVPGSSFFREPVNHLIRFHFAKKDETLLEALNRLEGLRAKIPSRKKS